LSVLIFPDKFTFLKKTRTSLSGENKSKETLLYDWDKYIDPGSPEYAALNVLDNGFLLYKGRLYLGKIKTEPTESFHLDVLKKENWREVMRSTDDNDFELFQVKPSFFITLCDKENCSFKGYKVFQLKGDNPPQ